MSHYWEIQGFMALPLEKHNSLLDRVPWQPNTLQPWRIWFSFRVVK